MKTIRLLSVVMLSLVAAQSVQAFEPNWGKKIPVFIGGEEYKNFGYISFSPDGSTLAFTTSGKGIFTVSVNGGNATCILTQPLGPLGMSPINDLSYSPDGKQIAFSTGYQIWIFNLTTGESHPIPGDTTSIKYTPAWSHDGRYICYVKDKTLEAGVFNGLRYEWLLVYDTVTGEERTILEIPRDIGIFSLPTFYPDDSALLYSFVATIGGSHTDLYTVPLHGGQPRMINIIDDSGNKLWIGPSMHPDGIHAVVTKQDFSMVLVNLQTGRVRQLTPPKKTGESALFQEFSGDGAKISYIHMFPGTYPQSSWGKLYILDIDESILNDSSTQVTSAPNTFTLSQNYPNPFNPSTTISFNLPEQAQATLAIYNAFGQQIQILVDGMVPAGRHEAVWDGRDEKGNIVANGIYFSRLQAGNMVKSNKMLMMK